MPGEEDTQVLKSSLSIFEKAKPSAYYYVKMSWPLFPSLYEHTTSCTSSLFLQPPSLKAALEDERLVSAPHPSQCRGVVNQLLWLIAESWDLSLFSHPSLSRLCATNAHGGWRSLSAHIQSGARQLCAKEGAWELQMLGVGQVWMERIVWLCGWK